jgi:hypothetical protein
MTSRNEKKDRFSNPGGTPVKVGVNEFHSSCTCPQCFGVVEYVRRNITEGGWSGDPTKIDKDGTVPNYRLLRCRDCGRVFHRDGVGAHNIGLSADGVLGGNGRPKCLTSPRILVRPLAMARLYSGCISSMIDSIVEAFLTFAILHATSGTR